MPARPPTWLLFMVVWVHILFIPSSQLGWPVPVPVLLVQLEWHVPEPVLPLQLEWPLPVLLLAP